MAERKQWEINKIKYNSDYILSNYRRIALRLHNIHDVEMIKWMESKPNKQGYLKELIQADMDRASRERIKKNEE